MVALVGCADVVPTMGVRKRLATMTHALAHRDICKAYRRMAGRAMMHTIFSRASSIKALRICEELVIVVC